MAKHVVLFIYNSFGDPIVQGSVLTYIIRYKSKLEGSAKFTLITFEQKEYKLSKNEISKKKTYLAKLNITWVPLKYHSGGWLILVKKLYDMLNGLVHLIKLNRKTNIDLIYTVGSIGGSMGYFLAKLVNAQLLVHTFEPHSEFMANFDIWSRNSLAYKLLNQMELKLAQKADFLMTGTDAMIERINKVRFTQSGIFKTPSCVDLDKFKPNADIKNKIKNELNLNSKLVLLYVGKFGGIYFTHEPFIYFKHFLECFKNKNPHVLIISPNEKGWIKAELDSVGITKEYTILNNIPFNKIQNYIIAGDIGYCGIPPLPSQKYRSPIKNGEYLACGLPYIVYEGVSEDDIIARKNKVGVVLVNNSKVSIDNSLKELDKMLLEDRKLLSKRCRTAAEQYRGIEQTDKFYKQIFN